MIHQEFTIIADGVKSNGVTERHIPMTVDSTGRAVQEQAKSIFRLLDIPSGSRFSFARNDWSYYILYRKRTDANVGDKSPFETCLGTVP